MKINSEQEMMDVAHTLFSGRVACTHRPFGLSASQGAVCHGARALTPALPHSAIPRKEHEQRPTVIELIGDVGVGKTTFVRGLAKMLGIKEPVTSPSFTISKTYACPDGRNLVHYDFYRLSDPGLMVEDLAENLKNPDNIVVIEWSDSVKECLPENHVKINIKYNDDGSRELEVLK